MFEIGDVKQIEDLVTMGGIFYEGIDGGSYCDTPLNTWKLDPGVGFVCVE